jgi:glutathione synthase
MIMERINPPMSKAWMLRDGKLLEIDSLSEFGLFSCLFLDASRNEVLLNENFGTLMRTKGSHSNEGGVNSGYSVIDTCILFDDRNEALSASIEPNV